MKVEKVYQFEEAVRLHRKLTKLKHCFSEQWVVKYIQDIGNGYWQSAEITYVTEWKGKAKEVEAKFWQDFKGKGVVKVIGVYYQ